MKVFICVDNSLGMLFNNRRQSRDSVLIEDMARDIGDGKLFISPFSEKLFMPYDIRLKVSERFLEKARADDFCFVENMPLLLYLKEISELIIYRWNRDYPSDMKLDIEPCECGFTLISTAEFKGSSHEKITKEIYKK